jgi:hypothetical protein
MDRSTALNIDAAWDALEFVLCGAGKRSGLGGGGTIAARAACEVPHNPSAEPHRIAALVR